MGNEAIGFGAIRAGVGLVTGYPGTPSTEVLETIAENKPDDVYCEWSVNEKSALEVAAGASYSGVRTLVTMKQVGLNVASDPLMSLEYIGIKGGMVILVADDPGPISSQTEQDTRRFCEFSKLPCFDPSSPEEAYLMIADAYELSEKYATPVIFRPTTRICHACAPIELTERICEPAKGEFVKNPQWVIFPRLSFAAHKRIEERNALLRHENSSYSGNTIIGSGRKAIAAGGVSYAYVREAMELAGADTALMKVSTPYPFPEDKALELLSGADEVLVFEELECVIEKELIYICGKHGLKKTIHGKLDGTLPIAGEYSVSLAEKAICAYLGLKAPESVQLQMPALPMRPPVLCAGCPHRASFFAVKEAMKGKKSFFGGDIGCYTLGNAMPLDMVDTCLCMGAGITVAQGIKRACPDTYCFSFTGDSTFFHTGMPGIANAVYNGTKLTAVILDNSTTAMTGHQPNPSTGFTATHEVAERINIEKVLEGLGVGMIRIVDPFRLNEAIMTVRECAEYPGVSAIIFRAPCIALVKPKKPYRVAANKCIGCKKCITAIGCPAISFGNKKACVDSALCFGCGLCADVCPVGALSVRKEND